MKTPARWVVLASVFLSLGSGSELAAFTVMATAQETAAETSVSGTVTDSTGGVLIGATVTLRGAGGAARTAVTDVRGRYRFERVARGAHTLHANQDGFKPTTVELNVESGPVTTDLTLSAASLAEEVTVSFTVDRSHAALKFDSAIRDIPLSAKSYTQSFIKALNVKDASEVYTYMNGINRSGHGAFDTVIRGIAAGATNTLQVDGMPGLATRSVGPNVANIDRIEILKGPAAILYGRTQPGGLVNFVTKRPQAEPQYLFELRSGTFFGTGPDLGDNNSYRLGTDFTGPIGKGKHVLYRLIFSYDDTTSFRDATRKDVFVVPSLTWNISQATFLTLAGEYRRVRQSYDDGLVAPRNDIGFVAPSATVYQEPDDWEKDYGGGLSADFTKYFTNGLTWNFKVRTVHHGDERLTFENESVTDDFRVRRRDRHQVNTRDYYYLDTTLLRRVGTGSVNHSLLFGLGGGYEQRLQDARRSGNLGFFVNVYAPVYGQAVRPANGRPASHVRFDFYDYNIYALDRLDFGEHWKGLVGLRYQHNETKNKELRLTRNPQATSKRLSHVDYITGLVFQPDARWSLYGSATTSFDPQSFFAVDAEGNSNFDPETGRQFEGGVKTELAKGRVDATLALYHIKRKGVLVPLGGGISEQVGEERSQGLELDLRLKPVDNWQTILGYTYTDGQVTRDARPERVGARLLSTPKHAFNVWSRYDLTSGPARGLGVGIGLIQRGDRAGGLVTILGAGQPVSLTLPQYFRTDIGLYYVRGRGELTLRITNLFDNFYYEAARVLIRIVPGAPREATLSLRFRL